MLNPTISGHEENSSSNELVNSEIQNDLEINAKDFQISNEIQLHLLEIMKQFIENAIPNKINFDLENNPILIIDSSKNKMFDFLKHYMVRKEIKMLPLIRLAVLYIFNYVRKTPEKSLLKRLDYCRDNLPEEFQKCNSPQKNARIFIKLLSNKKKSFIDRLRLYELIFKITKQIYLNNIFSLEIDELTEEVLNVLNTTNTFHSNDRNIVDGIYVTEIEEDFASYISKETNVETAKINNRNFLYLLEKLKPSEIAKNSNRNYASLENKEFFEKHNMIRSDENILTLIDLEKFSFNDKNIVNEISATEIQQKNLNSLLSDKTNSETSQINEICSHVLDKSISNNKISNLFCNSRSPSPLNGNANLNYASLENHEFFKKYDFLKHYMNRRDENILPLIDLGISQIFHFVKSQSGDLSKIFDDCHKNMPKEFQKFNSPERIIRIYDQWIDNKESGGNAKCFINRLRIYEAIFETMKKIYLNNEIFGITENKFSFLEITEEMKLQRVTDMVMDRLKSMKIFYGDEGKISRDPRYKWFYKNLSERSQLIIDQILPNYSKRNESKKTKSIIKILKQNGTIKDTRETLE